MRKDPYAFCFYAVITKLIELKRYRNFFKRN